MSVNKVNSDGSLKRIAGGTLYADAPLGTILAFGGTTAPAGWMLCQGQALSRTTYAKLFAIIGTAFGAGDGSTTFNIPDLRGEFLRGAGTNSHSGQGNGGSVGTHQDATGIDSFITEQTTHRLVAGYGAQNRNSTINADSSTRSGLTGCSYQKVEQSITDVYVDRCFVRPTNTSVNYIIKVMMVSLPTDLDSAVDAKIAAKGVYSTSEVDTGKTWIDGKKIYRKVVNLGPMPKNTIKTTAHGITNADRFVDIRAIAYVSNSNTHLPIPYVHSGSNMADSLGIYVNATNVAISSPNYDFSPYSGYAILEYTKTT